MDLNLQTVTTTTSDLSDDEILERIFSKSKDGRYIGGTINLSFVVPELDEVKAMFTGYRHAKDLYDYLVNIANKHAEGWNDLRVWTLKVLRLTDCKVAFMVIKNSYAVGRS